MSLKTLATLACLSLVGTAGGVWLGGAAIGEIDPFYFTTPESTFVSDRLAYQSPDWAEVQIGEYQQEGLLGGIDRGPMPGAVYAAPAVATYGEGWADAAEAEAAPAPRWTRPQPAQIVVVREAPVRVWTTREETRAEDAPEWRRVARYAGYEEAEQEPEADAPEAEPEMDRYAAVQEIGTE